ncbi:hypothetical protein [Streptomyces sp. NBC_00828]|uniref:hypothetical protein n=1 Tax=Streptomyces sp. NBC_00828 TaxID=2903678 RepID=UPI00386399A6
MTKCVANGAGPEACVLTTGGSIDKIYTLQGEMEIGPPVTGELLERAGVTSHSIAPALAKDSLDLTSEDPGGAGVPIHVLQDEVLTGLAAARVRWWAPLTLTGPGSGRQQGPGPRW